MVTYIIETFHAHDEEIEHLHLPIGFAAITELLSVRREVGDGQFANYIFSCDCKTRTLA